MVRRRSESAARRAARVLGGILRALCAVALAAWTVAGCRTPEGDIGAVEDGESSAQTPRSVGIVRVSDLEARFVIVDFGVNRVPPAGTRMRVRRGGRLVGSVRIAEPVSAPLAAADIVEGTAEAGDLLE
jgi:hypothetical protein